jgi:DNA gyrase inhibitor GyrI
MAEHEIRILRMPAGRMALVNTVSNSPEAESIRKLMDWAKNKGLIVKEQSFRLLGRNNPPPEKGKSDYGYDAMITIPDDVDPEGEVQLFMVPERTCAVVRTDLANITRMWQYLYEWVQNSKYEIADHGLEELLNPLDTEGEYLFDLWLPIKE